MIIPPHLRGSFFFRRRSRGRGGRQGRWGSTCIRWSTSTPRWSSPTPPTCWQRLFLESVGFCNSVLITFLKVFSHLCWHPCQGCTSWWGSSWRRGWQVRTWGGRGSSCSSPRRSRCRQRDLPPRPPTRSWPRGRSDGPGGKKGKWNRLLLTGVKQLTVSVIVILAAWLLVVDLMLE